MKEYRKRKYTELTVQWNEQMCLAEECTRKFDTHGSRKHVENAKNIRAEMLKLGCKEPRRAIVVDNTWGKVPKVHTTYTSHIDMANSKAFDPPPESA